MGDGLRRWRRLGISGRTGCERDGRSMPNGIAARVEQSRATGARAEGGTHLETDRSEPGRTTNGVQPPFRQLEQTFYDALAELIRLTLRVAKAIDRRTH